MTLPQWWYDELRSLAVRSRQVVLLSALTGALTGLAVAGYEFIVVEVLIDTVLDTPVWAQAVIPVLGLFGGADEFIPAADVERFESQLTEAGVEHELTSYPGAPHSFFDRAQEQFASESEDAWRRLLDFLAAH